jgi:hypothetical protein
MHTEVLRIDPAEVAKLHRKYKEHHAWSTPVDHEIERIYSLIDKGKVIVQALESIRTAGCGDDNLPKLAISRADDKICHLSVSHDGSAMMSGDWSPNGKTAFSRKFSFDRGTFPATAQSRRWRYEAIVPHIPPDIRPKRGLANYHILFEAEWSRAIPVDPMLLRRIGDGDFWVVFGAWELTAVERAVLAGHLARRPQ